MKASQAGVAAALAAGAGIMVALAANATDAAKTPDIVRRGEYLATFGGCNDCHTPKRMTPQGPVPDPERLLSGQPSASPVPAVPAGALAPGKWMAMTSGDMTAWAGPWGISFAANLTPDPDTGLGKWTEQMFVTTIRTGKHLGNGRAVLPPMPVMDIAALSDADMHALFSYLQSIRPIRNLVPAPIPPKGP